MDLQALSFYRFLSASSVHLLISVIRLYREARQNTLSLGEQPHPIRYGALQIHHFS